MTIEITLTLNLTLTLTPSPSHPHPHTLTLTLKLGQRPRTNNYLEGYHRQLNARVRTNPDLWTWINEIRSSEESVICRIEQEQAQKRSTRSRKARYARDDEKLKVAKAKYMQDKDFDAYQKVLRALSHRYINVIEDATDSSDEGSFH